MFPLQVPVIRPDEFSRCDDQVVQSNQGKVLSPMQRSDSSLKASVEEAIWNDEVLRAIEYHEVDVHAKNGIVYLDGHIANTTSRKRIESALQSVPGVAGVRNNLVQDDKLTLEVAGALGTLERTHSCKFFTGSSHGVISINGIVSSETIKRQAERCAAENPNVRAVINHVRVSGVSEPEGMTLPFLQPSIGETIYFLDGPSGIVEKVIINPNNRRVIAMLLSVNFTDPRLSVMIVHVAMSEIRYLTKASGFLQIDSHERIRYQDFDPDSFSTPGADWAPPYPYCRQDVRFPVQYPKLDIRATDAAHSFAVAEYDASSKEHFSATDDLGSVARRVG